jgi:hypothetical protein
MSLMNELQRIRAFSMPLTCPRCDAPMKITTITPSITSLSLDDVVYNCPACHDERKQTVLRRD